MPLPNSRAQPLQSVSNSCKAPVTYVLRSEEDAREALRARVQGVHGPAQNGRLGLTGAAVRSTFNMWSGECVRYAARSDVHKRGPTCGP